MKGETRTIVLKDERPISWNTYYAGEHWSKRNRTARLIHSLIRAELDPEQPPFDGKVSITITAFVKSRPIDCDNLAAKLYIDGLKGWWFDDDTPDYIESIKTMVVVDPLSPRLEIEATQTGDTFRYSCSCCDRLFPTKSILRAHTQAVRIDGYD